MKSMIAIAALLAFCVSAGAHRLDEYLQATRIGVAMHRIDLSIDLTPGVAVAQQLLSSIDPDGNPRIPSHQGERYARRLLQDLLLELDGKQLRIKVIRVAFPARADMKAGEGTIHLQALARISRLKPAPHEILFRNAHLPRISVYLVNALVPESRTIQITHQIRDELQKEYHLSFEVRPAAKKAESP